jgi:integrase
MSIDIQDNRGYLWGYLRTEKIYTPKMARQSTTGKLAAVAFRQAKPKDKPYKLSDGGGLYLLINPNGSRYWRWKYRIAQKEKVLALGVYPDITAATARAKVLEAKQLLDQKIDPSIRRKQQKSVTLDNTFAPISDEWMKTRAKWSKGHADKVRQTIKADALPYLGNMPIKEIKTSDVLYVVRKIEARGALDVAARVKQRINSIFRYAIQTGYAEYNPVEALKDVLKTRKVQHRQSIQLDQLPAYLSALDKYSGYSVTRYALQFITMVFVRPGELRSAEWKDIDLDKSIWRIPAAKMKMDEEHIVPLSKQAIDLLKQVHQLTGQYDLVFPGSHNPRKPMSENTLTYAIRKRLGFDATAHGFRTTASTTLNESGFRVDVIERQLAHGERNKVRAAYNRSQYLAERTEMMQWYSDYLDGLKAGADVVPIHSAIK